MSNVVRIGRCKTDFKVQDLRILIIGHGGHGKDTFAEMLGERMGLKLQSSSRYALHRVVFPWFEKHLPGTYDNPEQCYADRRNRRQVWKKLISDYNRVDPSKLARGLLQEAPVYVGLRCNKEYKHAMANGVFTHVIWVDAFERVPKEPTMDVEYNPMTMYVVDNSGPIHYLEREVALAEAYLSSPHPKLV